MTLSEPRPYKNILKKKGVYTATREGNCGTIYMAIFTSTSIVQILDYVDKTHINNYYFRCSCLNKFKKKKNNNNNRVYLL